MISIILLPIGITLLQLLVKNKLQENARTLLHNRTYILKMHGARVSGVGGGSSVTEVY